MRIAGAGLAGSAAALAARQAGVNVRMWDPGRIPKHKVCGEFLTPEIRPVLEELGLWEAFAGLRPAPIRRMQLTFGNRSREGRFPEAAYGVSRYGLDALLRNEAERQGAAWIVERVPGKVDIVAHGRQTAASGGNRLFGFKAHFRGPETEAVELYFWEGFYVGVNPVEGGGTNVCGLGPEEGLRALRFDYDAVTGSCPALRDRLRPMTRAMEWLSTGPLVFQSQLANPPADTYLAGDALQFVDPFTGTGMSIALWTGGLAGRYAAEKRPTAEYYAAVRAGLEEQARWCERLRNAVGARWPLRLATWVPPEWLFAITRPKLERR